MLSKRLKCTIALTSCFFFNVWWGFIISPVVFVHFMSSCPPVRHLISNAQTDQTILQNGWHVIWLYSFVHFMTDMQSILSKIFNNRYAKMVLHIFDYLQWEKHWIIVHLRTRNLHRRRSSKNFMYSRFTIGFHTSFRTHIVHVVKS